MNTRTRLIPLGLKSLGFAAVMALGLGSVATPAHADGYYYGPYNPYYYHHYRRPPPPPVYYGPPARYYAPPPVVYAPPPPVYYAPRRPLVEFRF